MIDKIDIDNASSEELRKSLRLAYEKLDKLESELKILKKKFDVEEEEENVSTKEPVSSAKVVYSSPIESKTSVQSKPTVKMVQTKISNEELKQYAIKTAEKHSKGGFLGKGKVIEKPIGWEKFLFPYFDVEIEITIRDVEKRGWFKKEEVTKTIRGRTGLDGLTGAVIDVSPGGISYKYAFLKDLDAEEVRLLYWIGSGTFTTADLRGLGQSDAKSRRIADGLASKGILRRQATRPIQYTTKYPYPYNPENFVSLMEQYNVVESTSDDRIISPRFSENVIPSYLDKYWNKCNFLSSKVVHYPYYGIVYERENHTRSEIIDAVTGLRQEYLEKNVTVEVTKKIS